MTPLIATHSLEQVTRDDGRALLRITFPDLAVFPGQVVSVVGPSSSGKSTLMNVVAGLLHPTAGAVERHPLDLVSWGQLTFVPQALVLVSELTVLENIALGAGHLFPSPEDEVCATVDEVAASVDVARLLDRRIDELSVGERQRVMVARAAVARPRLLVADEPVAHQDDEHAASIMRLLASVADHGGACMIFSRNTRIVPSANQVVRLQHSDSGS